MEITVIHKDRLDKENILKDIVCEFGSGLEADNHVKHLIKSGVDKDTIRILTPLK